MRIFWIAYGEYRGRRKIKPFIRYVLARLEENNREEAYRIFVTKSLQLIPQNKYLTMDYMDIAKPKKINIKSSNEIIVDTIKKAGLKFK